MLIRIIPLRARVSSIKRRKEESESLALDPGFYYRAFRVYFSLTDPVFRSVCCIVEKLKEEGMV